MNDTLHLIEELGGLYQCPKDGDRFIGPLVGLETCYSVRHGLLEVRHYVTPTFYCISHIEQHHPRNFCKVIAPHVAQRIRVAFSNGERGLDLANVYILSVPSGGTMLGSVGAIAAKAYPVGVTTHSEDGVSDFTALYPVFEAMQKIGMTLSLHGEWPGSFCLDREAAFIENELLDLIERFPDLKIVLEHISTRNAVDFLFGNHPNLAATITVHHLLITLDDVVGDKLQPHNFCKPIAKFPEDQTALIEAAISGDPHFFLGTDSAPHPRFTKECSHCAAGIFTAPVALPLLAELFESVGKLECLEAFTSTFGANFYGLPLNQGTITLTKDPWMVPEEYDGIVPFMAGREITWKVA